MQSKPLVFIAQTRQHRKGRDPVAGAGALVHNRLKLSRTSSVEDLRIADAADPAPHAN
jgi:hypothetical protein